MCMVDSNTFFYWLALELTETSQDAWGSKAGNKAQNRGKVDFVMIILCHKLLI